MIEEGITGLFGHLAPVTGIGHRLDFLSMDDVAALVADRIVVRWIWLDPRSLSMIFGHPRLPCQSFFFFFKDQRKNTDVPSTAPTSSRVGFFTENLVSKFCTVTSEIGHIRHTFS